MVRIGISEFTFGFAFLHEQTLRNWKGIRAAPVLPSLRGEQLQGWDAKLPRRGVDFYYQFKLSDRLSRSNASFIADGTYAAPYYRLALHSRHGNLQHQRLRSLSHKNPRTYYVAPEFETTEQFNAAFLAKKTSDQSRLIPVTDCEDINGDEQHYITFQAGQLAWRQHSEPTLHEQSFLGRDLENIYRNSEEQWKTLDAAFAARLLESTAELAPGRQESEALTADRSQASRAELLLRVSDTLATIGTTMVLVGPPP